MFRIMLNFRSPWKASRPTGNHNGHAKKRYHLFLFNTNWMCRCDCVVLFLHFLFHSPFTLSLPCYWSCVPHCDGATLPLRQNQPSFSFFFCGRFPGRSVTSPRFRIFGRIKLDRTAFLLITKEADAVWCNTRQSFSRQSRAICFPERAGNVAFPLPTRCGDASVLFLVDVIFFFFSGRLGSHGEAFDPRERNIVFRPRGSEEAPTRSSNIDKLRLCTTPLAYI